MGAIRLHDCRRLWVSPNDGGAAWRNPKPRALRAAYEDGSESVRRNDAPRNMGFLSILSSLTCGSRMKGALLDDNPIHFRSFSRAHTIGLAGVKAIQWRGTLGGTGTVDYRACELENPCSTAFVGIGNGL